MQSKLISHPNREEPLARALAAALFAHQRLCAELASMSNTVEKTVVTYVQLNDRQALEDLRTYRQGLAFHLKARTGLDFSLLIDQIDAEIAVIEAGLDRLSRAPAAHELNHL